MKKQVNTNNAPTAIGPYSQAILLDKLAFTSGQLPLNSRKATIVEGGITELDRASLANLKAINAVSTGVFESEPAPARSYVEVEAIAYIKN